MRVGALEGGQVGQVPQARWMCEWGDEWGRVPYGARASGGRGGPERACWIYAYAVCTLASCPVGHDVRAFFRGERSGRAGVGARQVVWDLGGAGAGAGSELMGASAGSGRWVSPEGGACGYMRRARWPGGGAERTARVCVYGRRSFDAQGVY